MADGRARLPRDQAVAVFEVLVYTDCASDESLSGRTGFQFTAKSSDATLTDEENVRRRMLHSPPIAIPAMDWHSHPPTCAYAAIDGRLYLSRGRSTGQTLSGRYGNQLTQTILTSDPYSILPRRPAQLYSSPNWTLDKPTTRELPGWETPLEIDPAFEIGGLHSLIVDDEWATAIFPVFLTMVEQTQAEPRTRLIIKHPDQELVMKWIALASQFLEDAAALALEFRVFVENPMSASAHIVGAHPATSPALTATSCQDSGINLVDLQGRAYTSLQVSETAARHARWFTTGDPFDALEAVAASRRWSDVVPPETAAEAAEIACLTSGTTRIGSTGLQAALAALAGLATFQRFDELESFGDPLVDAVAGYGHGDPTELSAMVDCLWKLDAAGLANLAQGLALIALEWAAARPEAAAGWAQESATARQLRWVDAEAQHHGAGLVSSILHAAPATELPEMFTAMNGLGTMIAVHEVQQDIHRLSSLWAADPSLSAKAQGWLHYSAVVQSLLDKLANSLAHRDPAALQALREGAWDWLMPTPWTRDPRNPLSPWLASRALATAPQDARAAIISATGASLPAWAWELILASSADLDPGEAASWIRTHGVIDPELATSLEQAVLQGFRGKAPTEGTLSLLDTLSMAGVSGVTPKLMKYVQVHLRISELFQEARELAQTVPNNALVELARDFGSWQALYGDHIARALVEAHDLDTAVRLARQRGGAVEAELRTELERGLRAGELSSLVGALRLLPLRERPIAHAAKAALDSVWDDSATEGIRRGMERGLPPGWVPAYEDYARAQAKGRLTRGILRTARSVLPGKETM